MPFCKRAFGALARHFKWRDNAYAPYKGVFMARIGVIAPQKATMPKIVPQNELHEILEAVTRFPQGASFEDVFNSLMHRLPRRTLQRRLANLVKHNKLIVEGRGRAHRYRNPAITGTLNATLGVLEAQISGELYVPTSPEGESIKKAIREPLQKRRPVGHNRVFLDAYRPNETYYLTPEIRRHLFESGQSTGGQRPAGTYIREIFNRLLIDLSWNSSRLEGNTYSLLETERLIQLGETAQGKDAQDAQMILNHKRAIEFLVDEAELIGFNRYTILNLHALLSDNLLADPKACGRLRQRPVGIGGTVYHPLEVPQLVEECFQQILDTANAINDPFEQSFFVMVQLPYLQPFEDVNKRVSRLAANIPMIRQNLSPLSFVDVPDRAYVDGILGVYELNGIELFRDVFVWAYERSCARYAGVCQSLGDPDPFRMRHRALILDTVSAVVCGAMDKESALALIRQRAAARLSPDDRGRFVEVVETELMSLHEGNIARYRLRPPEFQVWHQTWH